MRPCGAIRTAHCALRGLDLIIDTGPRVRLPPVWYPGDDLLTPLVRRTGIPIGNLTSQFLANLYLDDLDHYVKQVLRMTAYLRYVDDLVVLDDSKQRLAEVREIVRERLAADRLRLHSHKAHITPVRVGLDLLGYRVFPNGRRLRNDNGFRFARRLRAMARAYGEGRMDLGDIDPRVQSWIGHARHADTEGLRRAIFAHTVFVRGTGQEAPSA